MIVDWHAHVYPPDLAGGRRGGGDSPLTIEKLLEAHERAGIDLCVVSNTMHHLRDKSLADALSFVQRWNAYGAEIQQKYSGRIVVFSSTLPCGGAPFVKELERAVTEYGLKGVLINSSHQGAYPDDDEARPFFELVTRLGNSGDDARIVDRVRRRADGRIWARLQRRQALRRVFEPGASHRARRF